MGLTRDNRSEGPETRDEGKREGPLFVQAAAKAMQVLEVFGREPRPLSLGEIAALTGMTKSTAQRTVYTLQQLGYLERDAEDRGYVPGLRLLDRSFDYLRTNPMIERATAVLLELRRNARERVDLSLFDDISIVYAVRLQSKRETFNATVVGRRLPAFCTSGGRAAMAKLTDPEIDDILARSTFKAMTPKTLIEPQAVREKIEEARRDGYAVSIEESQIGEVALAVAVADEADRPLGAVHIAGSLSEWTVEAFKGRFVPLAAEAARAISRK